MRRLSLIVALALIVGNSISDTRAQQQPASMAVTTGSPQTLYVLDKAGNYVPLGSFPIAGPLSFTGGMQISDGITGPVGVNPGGTSPVSGGLNALVIAKSPNDNGAIEAGGNLAQILQAIVAGNYTNNVGPFGAFAAIGGQGQSTEQTAVTAGNPVGHAHDQYGKAINWPWAVRGDMFRTSVFNNTNTPITLIPSSTGLKAYAWVECFRSDTSQTPIWVTFNDTLTSVANTNPGTIELMTNNGSGGGFKDGMPIPLVFPVSTAATFTVSTSTTTVYCNARGFYAH